MALKPCPRCGNHISDKAKKCPKCGVSLSKKSSSENVSPQKKNETPIESYDFNDGKQSRNNPWLKIIFAIIFIGVIVGGILYFNNERNNKEALMIAEQARQDSILAVQKEVERLEQIRQDSLFRNFQSPDLALFNLHARVKSLESNDNFYLNGLIKGGAIEFDENGEWNNYKNLTVALSNGSKIRSLQRDKNGYITKINYIDDSEPCAYNFKWKEGKVVSCRINGYEFGADYIYKYNDNFLVSINTNEGAFEVYSVDNFSFSDYQTDKWGNWIECKVMEKSWTESTEWDDFGNTFTRKSDVKNKEAIRKQTISYYDLNSIQEFNNHLQ